MSTSYFPSTSEIALAFADEISVLGGSVSESFDDGSRHVVSFRSRIDPSPDLSGRKAGPLATDESYDVLGAVELAADSLGWLTAGRRARRTRRAWKELLRGEHVTA